MITAILIGFGVTISCVVFVAPIMWVLTLDNPPTWGIVVSAAWCLFACTVALALVIDNSSSPDHSWEGGNGPATKCHFEDRLTPAGKVMVPATWTVCD